MTTPDPIALADSLGAVWSPDLDGYASGRLPASAIRCLMCTTAPCSCEALGLVFGSAAYFARTDALHGRVRPTASATCSAPGCPLTAQCGEHPAGMAIAASGPPRADGLPSLPTSVGCVVEVSPR